MDGTLIRYSKKWMTQFASQLAANSKLAANWKNDTHC